VSSSNETDLFWAVRGGGGGTFGVVTSIKYKLHMPPSEFNRILCTIASSELTLSLIDKFLLLYSDGCLIHDNTMSPTTLRPQVVLSDLPDQLGCIQFFNPDAISTTVPASICPVRRTCSCAQVNHKGDKIVFT